MDFNLRRSRELAQEVEHAPAAVAKAAIKAVDALLVIGQSIGAVAGAIHRLAAAAEEDNRLRKLAMEGHTPTTGAPGWRPPR